VTAGVTGFKLYWGLASRSYTSSLNVGLPAQDLSGAYYYDLVVADGDTIFAAVSAINAIGESPKSNEIMRAGITSGGGSPPPPSPPPPSSSTKPDAPTVTASAWLVHVALATTGATATNGWITL